MVGDNAHALLLYAPNTTVYALYAVGVVDAATLHSRSGIDFIEGHWLYCGAANLLGYQGAPAYSAILADGINLVVNSSAGASTFARDVTINGVLYKGGVAYTHPDFVFEQAYAGRIERFKDALGARTYQGLRPLHEVEAYTREHWRLPDHVRDGRHEVFRRGDEMLAEVEKLYLYLFEHERRLAAVEAR